MRKITPNGKAVIYTEDGAKVLDAEVIGLFNVHDDTYRIRFNEPKKYLLIGGARINREGIQNATKLRPEAVEQMMKFTRTRFFRFMLELMKQAKFEPIHSANHFVETEDFHHDTYRTGVDFSTSVEELDAQFYRRYNFTPAMIAFIEERHSYDDIRHEV